MGISFTWQGSSVAATRASGAIWTVADYDFGPLMFKPRVQRLDMQQGEREIYAPLPEYPWAWRLAVKVDASALTGSSPTDEARLYAAWREAASFFDPAGGRGALMASTVDLDGAAVERYLLANVLPSPQFKLRNAEPTRLSESGAYLVAGAPYLIYVASGDVRFPWWIDNALYDQDTAPATAQLAISGSGDTVTINNPGDRWCGVRVVVSGVSGTVNGFTLTSSTNSDVMAVSKSSAMANGEYLDWYATDVVAEDKSSGWIFSGAGDSLRLDPGDNTITSVRTGGGSGSLTLTLSWPGIHYTL